MQAHLPEEAWKDRALFLHNIHDLYAQLDVNEDGLVEWSEMFDRRGVSESGAANSAGKAILPYYTARVADARGTGTNRSDVKDGHIEGLSSIATADKVSESAQSAARRPGRRRAGVRAVSVTVTAGPGSAGGCCS